MPRMTGRQVHRANHPGSDARQYYRWAVFLPFIDVCLQQLRDRFQAHHAKAYNLSLLLPAHCHSAEVAAIKEAARLYDQFLPEGACGLPGGRVSALEGVLDTPISGLASETGIGSPIQRLNTRNISINFNSASYIRHHTCHHCYWRTVLQRFEVCQILPAVNDARGQAEWFGTAVHK